MTEKFNVRSEILSAIGKTNDENMKLVLLLMLGVLDEIGAKIDTVISDEVSLKEMVLNGHTAQHHAHHDWIAQRIAHQGRCEWANKEIAMQQELAATKKGVLSKLLETVVSQIGVVIVTAIVTFLGFLQFSK